jgi:hypothetical protein
VNIVFGCAGLVDLDSTGSSWCIMALNIIKLTMN